MHVLKKNSTVRYVESFLINKGIWKAMKAAGGTWYDLQMDLAKKGFPRAKNTFVYNRFKVTVRLRNILHYCYGIDFEDFNELIEVYQTYKPRGTVDEWLKIERGENIESSTEREHLNEPEEEAVEKDSK